MKAIFPTKGVVIVTKYNVNVLRDFYRDNLINSKMFAIYQQANYNMQVGNFNYFPKKANFILYQAHLLSLKQLQEIIAGKIRENPELFNKKQQNNKDMQESDDIEEISDEPLDDNFIKSNPFFKTLTAIEDEN